LTQFDLRWPKGQTERPWTLALFRADVGHGGKAGLLVLELGHILDLNGWYSECPQRLPEESGSRVIKHCKRPLEILPEIHKKNCRARQFIFHLTNNV